MNPIITLLSRPLFGGDYQGLLQKIVAGGDAQWIQDTNSTDAERLIEFAGRVCYLSFGRLQSPRTNAEYIANLIRRGHDSVLEHAMWTFALAGVSRAFTHQMVRHRVGFSFSQLSQQYHDETDTTPVRPAEILDNTRASAIWDAAIATSRDAYAAILNELGLDESAKLTSEQRRAFRSAARSVLPNALSTVVIVTANARAIRHFLKVRGCIKGDSEMRRVSGELLTKLRPEAPSLFADFELAILDDGLPLVTQIAI